MGRSCSERGSGESTSFVEVDWGDLLLYVEGDLVEGGGRGTRLYFLLEG